MFLGLAAAGLILGAMALRLPGGTSLAEGSASPAPNQPIGKEGLRILVAMALFTFGSLAIWPFIERTAGAIGIAQVFGGYTMIGPFGGAICIAAIAFALPVARRLDRIERT